MWSKIYFTKIYSLFSIHYVIHIAGSAVYRGTIQRKCCCASMATPSIFMSLPTGRFYFNNNRGKYFCVSMATTLTRMCHNVTLYVLCLICYCLPFFILNFVNKSNEIPVNTSSAWWLFFIKASFNLPHFLGYVVYQRYGRKHLKTWMSVVEECCGLFQAT